MIPPERTRYLAEIVEASRTYDRRVDEQVALARQLHQLHGAIRLLREDGEPGAHRGEPGEVAPDLSAAAGDDAALLPADRPVPADRARGSARTAWRCCGNGRR